MKIIFHCQPYLFWKILPPFISLYHVYQSHALDSISDPPCFWTGELAFWLHMSCSKGDLMYLWNSAQQLFDLPQGPPGSCYKCYVGHCVCQCERLKSSFFLLDTCSFLFNSLLRCNLHTLWCTYLKCTTQWFLVHIRVGQLSPQSTSEYFITSKRNPVSTH